MTTILRRPASMSFIAPYPYPDTPTDPLQLRPPLTQLHNRAPGTRSAYEQYSSWLERTKGASLRPNTTKSNYNPYTPPSLTPDVSSVSSVTSVTPMLGPQSGGLYRANENGNGFTQRSAWPRSPLDDISPKHVENTQETANRDQRGDPDQIAHHLQIPSAINSSKASLSEFAAQVRAEHPYQNYADLHTDYMSLLV